MQRLGVCLLFVFSVLVISEAHVDLSAVQFNTNHQHIFKPLVHREKRQNGEDCDNAQRQLYENHNDCFELFYNSDSNPFFNSHIDRDSVNNYCGNGEGQLDCGGSTVIGLMENVTEYCGVDLHYIAEMLSLSCDQDNSRDYCLYEFGFMSSIFNGVNDTIAAGYNRCLTRNVTEDPCPDSCKVTLTGIQNNVGCCYSGLLATEDLPTAPYMVKSDVFKDCGLRLPGPCSASSKKRRFR